jgi:hypothetical protein
MSGNPGGQTSSDCVQGAERHVTADAPTTESRPLNPLAALTLVLVFPGKTFRRLTERPHWILPLAFVVVSVMVNRMLALSGGLMDDMLRDEAFLSGAGLAEAKSAALTFSVVASVVAVPIVTILQSLFFKIAGLAFGGRNRFRVVFSAVCHASVPLGISALAFAALMPITRSATAAANLSFLVDPTSRPFLWCLLMELDLSAIWFFILLGIAAEPVFDLPRRRARLAALLFAVIYIVVMTWTGKAGASRMVDPYSDWRTTESGAVTLRAGGSVGDASLHAAARACSIALDRVEELTGLTVEGAAGEGGRIECYLYPSFEEKLRVTGDAAVAHRVEWANAVHLAWVEGADAALTREMLKLMGAQAHGKVYTPLIRDGTAVLAGETWGGLPVRAAGRDLLERKVLPELDMLVDAVMFAQLDERLSQPAAGSFMAFLLDSEGVETIRGLYGDSAGRSGAAEPLLEATLGDSLEAIEVRWLEFLESETGASG